MTEEKEIKKAYEQYQLGTQGFDMYEEGAFRAGWEASKNFFKPDVSKNEVALPIAFTCKKCKRPVPDFMGGELCDCDD